MGALEAGRAYVVTARSGLAWAQLDVALPGAPANQVWVSAAEVPELSVAANVADLATPMPAPAPQVIYVAAQPGAPTPAPAAEVASQLEPEPTPAYLIPPATPAPRSVVVREFPTAPPCRLGEVGSALRVCNGVVP
ncbi:MAG: hypothetical protein HGA45_29980 [Chloroflexales bacterium]|nr:hypothetical protein [Chloroflexales bacterium]